VSNLPETMTAMEISEAGGPEVLKPATRPTPAPGPGEALIKVAAAGVNRPDLMQRAGLYPAPPGASDLPGLEVAGEVVALGEGATGVAVGDSVTALTPGGGYAEYCVTAAGHCLPYPDGFDAVQAAALPETYFTVWTNVFERGALKPGESLLVHGGASGIGTTAIQLAHAHGVTVYATAGSADKCQACEDLGADRAINYRDEDFVEIVNEATGGKGVDVILDMVAGPYIARDISCLAPDGRLVIIALMGGRESEVAFFPVMAKRLTITGSTLRPQSVEAKTRMAGGLRETAWPWLSAGRIKPIIQSTYPLAEAAAAHAELEAGDHVGKIMLTVG
jgi:NADPH2:quinone reductase